MHTIPIRIMQFEVPASESFHPLYIAGNAQLSYQHTATGLYVAHLEPFFVKSLRRVMDRIHDAELYECVDRFCRQESQHYQRHVDFNKLVLAHGYPGLRERVDQLKRDFDGYLESESDQFRIGYIEGFESFTTQLAMQLIRMGVYDHKRTQPEFGELYKWHMLEEIEHRNVAFDVYQYLYGNYLYRARMCWIAQHHMFRFFRDCEKIMSPVDVKRHSDLCRIRLKHSLQARAVTSRMRMRSMMPGYTPHHYKVPSKIEHLSSHFTMIARSVS